MLRTSKASSKTRAPASKKTTAKKSTKTRSASGRSKTKKTNGKVATPLPVPLQAPEYIAPAHDYTCFGGQLGMLQDLFKNQAPSGKPIAVVVTPQDQEDAPPRFIQNLPRLLMSRSVLFCASVGDVPAGCEAVVVIKPSDTPIIYAGALAKVTPGPVIVVSRGDPMFGDFRLVGDVLDLRLFRCRDMTTMTVYALRYRPPVERKKVATPLPPPVTIPTKALAPVPVKPTVLFVVDRPEWCLDRTARKVQSLLVDFDVRVMSVQDVITSQPLEVDVLIARGERWEEVRRVVQTRAGAALLVFEDPILQDWWKQGDTPSCDVLIAANEQIAATLRKRWSESKAPPVFVIEAAVDTAQFIETPLPPSFVAGWVGNSAYNGGEHKGLALIKEACRMASVSLAVVDASTPGAQRAYDTMPAWYQTISVLVCASSSEGAPNPVLEALASGRPVISTDVGIVRKLVTDRVNGLIVERDVQSLVTALWEMRKGLRSFAEFARPSAERYDWSHRITDWRNAISTLLKKAAPARIEVPKETSASTKTKILLTCDVPGWAFDVNLRAMAKYLRDRFEFDMWYVNPTGDPTQPQQELPEQWAYNAVYVPYHRWAQLHALAWEKALGCLRSSYFWTETPSDPGEPEFHLVRRFRAFHAVTEKVYKQLRDGGCENVVYLTNPVDTELFDRPTEVVGEVIPSWNGNAMHGYGPGSSGPTTVDEDVKGFVTLIDPVVRRLVEDKTIRTMPIAEYSAGGQLRRKPEDMPEFYRRANLSICASKHEGAPNSIMEAMAMGHAVISTRVGNLEEVAMSQLQHYGASGILFIDERTEEALEESMRALLADPKRVEEMGAINRVEILERWSWHVWAERYAEFLKTE